MKTLIFSRLRQWTRRHLALTWWVGIALLAMPVAQAMPPRAQWIDVPYCASADSSASAESPDAQRGSVGASQQPHPAHLRLVFTAKACPPSQGHQPALPVDERQGGLHVAQGAPERVRARQLAVGITPAYAQPPSRAPPSLATRS